MSRVKIAQPVTVTDLSTVLNSLRGQTRQLLARIAELEAQNTLLEDEVDRLRGDTGMTSPSFFLSNGERRMLQGLFTTASNTRQ